MNKNRPEKSEYAEFYENYVSMVSETDIVAALRDQIAELENLGITEENGDFAYAEGKWTMRQTLNHLIDGERVFAYRAFRISRGDQTPLAGFEQNFYVANSNSSAQKIADLFAEFSLLRQSNIILFKNLTEEMWSHIGTASENAVSVRAIAYIMVGHVRHHTRILRERYLS